MEQEEIEKTRKAGQIHQEIVGFVKGVVKKDMKLLDLANQIDEKIKALGALPAFPVNLSVNEQAAHCTPGPHDETLASGLLKIDIGLQVDGFVADSAFSVDLEGNEENKNLVEAAEAGLAAGLETLGKGVRLSEIGASIQKAITEKGAVPIKNLSGHKIEQYNLHAGLNIPNYDSGQGFELEEGVYAVEPFATNGFGRVRDGKPSGIYRLDKPSNVRDPFARKVLEYIRENFLTLPFCSRWIVEGFGSRGLLALRQIEAGGILHHYPQLIEEGKGTVAQAEHTVLLLPSGEKIITTKN